MKCMHCGETAQKSTTTSVTDLRGCLVIIRNVPCYKCPECSEIIYTADVLESLEKIIEQAKNLAQDISVVDYQKAA